MKKKTKVIFIVLAVLAVFIWSPFSKYALSLGVMSVYSGIHERDSIMAEKGIDLKIPGGGATPEKDWYPFVMTFNDGAGFRNFTGDAGLDLTILYNFPAFDLLKGCSRLYDAKSSYYNGFYGAYLVTAGGQPYGFKPDGSLDLGLTAQVPQFDFQRLVLADLGITAGERVFKWAPVQVEENVEYLGYNGWTRVDADLLVNGVIHEKKGFVRSYLQYGAPEFGLGESEPFQPVEMKGRIYAKYFSEWETSVFFYVLAVDENVTESCDKEILSKGRIE